LAAALQLPVDRLAVACTAATDTTSASLTA
jgi:hypothetical protein